MGEIAISLRDVSKCFKRYARPVDRLKEILIPHKSRAEEFWALRDINLEVAQGEAIGIVGRNGAGKSTLLQIIAGTLTPTTGEVQVKGRVSALLELGSGFNLEFTGRQNVFFNGRILGLSQTELEQKFDDIAAFADIGDFIDQPVKTYSSGMFVRLAFAVAVSTEPDILIVDEALAVGDIYFQQKCFERIRYLTQRGTTLLFVSHDTGAVYNICQRAALFESGKLILQAKTKQVIDLYEARLLKQQDAKPEAIALEPTATATTSDSNGQTASVAVLSSDVKLHSVRCLNDQQQPIESIVSGQSVQLVIELEFLHDFEAPVVGFKLRDRTGATIFVNHTYNLRHPIGAVSQGTVIAVCFQFEVLLGEGEYTITIGVADGEFRAGQFTRSLAYIHDTAVLKVLRDPIAPLWGGIVNLNPSVAIHRQAHV